VALGSCSSCFAYLGGIDVSCCRVAGLGVANAWEEWLCTMVGVPIIEMDGENWRLIIVIG
jgi:hypothetical protein